MAYVTTAEVSAIRKALKAKYPNMKFSVRNRDHTSVDVSIMKSDIDFSDILVVPCGNYGSDETKAVDNVSVNHYYPDNYGKFADLFKGILEIIKKAPGTVEGGREWFDKSDSMSDYFHTAFYIDLSIGKWDKPYECVAK